MEVCKYVFRNRMGKLYSNLEVDLLGMFFLVITYIIFNEYTNLQY